MEQDAKRLLFERLDECLKAHADMLAGDNIGAIYELQELAELHYYLKAEHEFTPAEVEALLEFQDPLDVARWCKKDNTHAHSFPICELLQEINAYERFELAADNTRVDELFARFREVLSGNYFAYREKALSWDKETLVNHAAEIAAVSKTYSALMSEYVPVMEEMNFFLQFDDPLHAISQFGPFDDILAAMEMLYSHREELMAEVFEAPPAEPAEPAASIRKRLQAAMKEVKNHTPMEKPGHDTGAR